MIRRNLLLIAATATSLSACAADPALPDPEETHVGQTEDAIVASNGIGLNGVGLNGVGLNGVGLNGVGLNGVSLNGVSLNGVGLNGVSLNGTSLNGVSQNGVSQNGVSQNGVSQNGVSQNGVSQNGVSQNGVSQNGVSINGLDMVGAVLEGELSDGGTLPLRIDAISRGEGDDDDVYFYTVSYETDAGWQPLCGLEPDGSPVTAIPLSGRWDDSVGTPTGGSHIDDPDVITFACQHRALAKCVLLGYKPWATKGPLSLADHHQACTRLIRADYCGDGVSWTRDGTTIDLYDHIGIQEDTEPSWVFEAEFRPDGAACVSRKRIDEMTTIDGAKPRKCVQNRQSGKCGKPAHFGTGTLLMVRHPQWLND